MNRNRTRIVLSVLLLLSVCFLSGCQLALEDELTAHESERICGVFVTIGLNPSELYNNQLDNTQFKINRKGEIELQATNPASRQIEGTMTEDGHVKFGKYHGYYIGEGELIDPNGEKQLTNFADPGFYDVKVAHYEKEDGKDISFEGTLSIDRNSSQIIHMNPVYQREDGGIYTILGYNVGYSSSGNASGIVLSQSFSNTIASSGGSHRGNKKENTSFKVNIEMTNAATQILIKEMNSKDELIRTTEYYPDSPEEFIVDPNAYYILVEERNNNKTDNITRYIYNLENIDLEEYYVGHTCHFPGDDDVIGVKQIRFINKKLVKKENSTMSK